MDKIIDILFKIMAFVPFICFITALSFLLVIIWADNAEQYWRIVLTCGIVLIISSFINNIAN